MRFYSLDESAGSPQAMILTKEEVTALTNRTRKVKATSTGTPALAGAAAFASLLAASMAKKPELKLVEPEPGVAELAKPANLHKYANC